ncbi:MAG TPA: glycerophosphodiester phosphodiesterase family protein [Spirochaetia bacterium]|nr:glycerophosphodiester phosphodiesterase family protein [Spirochaetia bacterium]
MPARPLAPATPAIPRRRLLVLGHRGYRARYPENTLLAFRSALEAGADGVECDLQKTADGHYVVIHDPTVDRVTGAAGAVARMSLAELRDLDFGRGERIPELSDLLSILPADSYLDLELKEETLTSADCEPILRILADRTDPERLMISSFEPELLRPFRARGCVVGFLVGDRMMESGPQGLLSVLGGLRPQYVNLPVETFSVLGRRRARFLVGSLRMMGCRVLWWTVNEPAELALVARGARIIVTDCVEEILRAAGR